MFALRRKMKPNSPKRLFVVAQFDPDNGLPAHVEVHLQALRAVATRLVLVSNSSLNRAAWETANAICDHVLQRPNEGLDFAAWRDALTAERLEDYDWTILTNSSVIGPLFPLEPVLKAGETGNPDFWGMVRSEELAPHIPSWFMSFSQKVTLSPVWHAFWENVDPNLRKRDIVRRYEVGLTEHLEKNGFHGEAITNNRSWRLEFTPRPPFLVWRNNDSLLDPKGLLTRGVPYLKRSLICGKDRRRQTPLAEIKATYQTFDWERLGL
jgi:rhamnosyltransferase